MFTHRFNNHLIIDGHGEELTGDNFHFTRPQGKECDLYCYIRQGLGIGIHQSNQIIADVVNKNNISREIAGTQLSSRINPAHGLVIDKKLYAIQADPNTGVPQWSNDHLFNTSREITINGVKVLEFKKDNTTYIRLPYNSPKTLKLSDIINHYTDKQYNVLWVVCRVER